MNEPDPDVPPTADTDTTPGLIRAEESPPRPFSTRIVHPLPVTPRTIRFNRASTPTTGQRRPLRFTPFRPNERAQSASPTKRPSESVHDAPAKRPRISEESVESDKEIVSVASSSGSKGKQRATDHGPGPTTAGIAGDHADLLQQSPSDLRKLYSANERQVEVNRANKIEHLRDPSTHDRYIIDLQLKHLEDRQVTVAQILAPAAAIRLSYAPPSTSTVSDSDDLAKLSFSELFEFYLGNEEQLRNIRLIRSEYVLGLKTSDMQILRPMWSLLILRQNSLETEIYKIHMKSKLEPSAGNTLGLSKLSPLPFPPPFETPAFHPPTLGTSSEELLSSRTALLSITEDNVELPSITEASSCHILASITPSEQVLWSSFSPIEGPTISATMNPPIPKKDLVHQPHSLSHPTQPSSLAEPSLLLEDGTLAHPYLTEVEAKCLVLFGHSTFFPHQLSAITAALNKKSLLLLLSTGAGKSLCYQLPAVCTANNQSGVTVIIQPLIQLIADQVQSLQKKGVQVYAFVQGQSWEERAHIRAQLCSPSSPPSLLYLTVEMFFGKRPEDNLPASLPDFPSSIEAFWRDLHAKSLLRRIVIDEGHVITEDGERFRPLYLELGSICKKFPTVPITIASASITPFTCDKILSLLGMDKSELEIISSTLNRPNLRYHVVPSMRSHKATIEAIVQFITNHHLEEPGIIYCTTKEKCDIIVAGLVSYELKAEAYYSTANNKPQIVQAWRNNTCHIIVATIAFGLGIDKPDVRFIIHFSMPRSLICYAQETGRAGRDGKPADCLMFYNWKAPQRHWWYSTHTPGQSLEQSAHQALSTLSMSQFSIDLVNCRRTLLLKNFGEEFDPSLCNSCCDNCSLKYAVGAYDFAQAAKDFVAMIKEVADKNCPNIGQNNSVDSFYGAGPQVHKKGYNKLDGFGKGRHLKRDDIKWLFEHLLSLGFLSAIPFKPTWSRHYHFKIGQFSLEEELAKNSKLFVRVIRSTEHHLFQPPLAKDDSTISPEQSPSQEHLILSSPLSTCLSSIEPEPQPSSSCLEPSGSTTTTQQHDGSIYLKHEEEIFKQLSRLRKQIKSQSPHIKKIQDILTDDALKALSILLPQDANGFKEALEGCPEDKEADRKWNYYGRKFVNICQKKDVNMWAPLNLE